MAGIGLVLSIAKDALFAQTYGLDVTSQNIANESTSGYSRQTAIYETKDPAASGQLLLGQGVNVSKVIRVTDQFIEDRLIQQKSGLANSEEMENYANVLEAFFGVDSDTSLGTMMSDFWNYWQDISDNPSGSSERSALYGYSQTITDQFNSLATEMKQLETDLTNNISSGIIEINQITAEIAEVNKQIVAAEAGGNTANDLRDKRNEMLTELSEYVDTKSFEQDNGSLTVLTANGRPMVQGISSYELVLGGENGDRVEWTGSGGSTTDITDDISAGKLGGWLDMRDEVLKGCELNLDALAKEFIWTVNQQHSQGVGLDAFGSTTGTYAASLTDAAVGTSASGLSFYDKIVDGSFNLWLYDENCDLVGDGATTINIDADATSMDDIAAQINNINTNITASVMEGKLQITAADGYSFAFSDDTSNILAALGINTYFTGYNAGTMGINDGIGNNLNSIAAAFVNDDGTFTSGDNQNALAISDLQDAAADIPYWICDRIKGDTEGSLTTTLEDYYSSFVGSLGVTIEGISSEKSVNETLVNNLQTLRDSVSAVSLDEEMTNLIKYQQAYNAAAKLISVADEMLDTLLGLK